MKEFVIYENIGSGKQFNAGKRPQIVAKLPVDTCISMIPLDFEKMKLLVCY